MSGDADGKRGLSTVPVRMFPRTSSRTLALVNNSTPPLTAAAARNTDAAPPAACVSGQYDERHRRHQHPRTGVDASRLGEKQSRGNDKGGGAPPAARFHLV